MQFEDRVDAAKQLIPKLEKFSSQEDTIVLALPRGGVILGFEIAKALNLPLDIVVSRKIGAPGQEEFAIGAITEDGHRFFDEGIIHRYGISEEYLETAIKKEMKEAKRRLKVYRGDRDERNLKGKTCILVDDGIATGHTMQAAIDTVRRGGASKIIVAVPVSAMDSWHRIKHEVDEAICIDTPLSFMAVGQFYSYFPQNADREVIELMEKAKSL